MTNPRQPDAERTSFPSLPDHSHHRLSMSKSGYKISNKSNRVEQATPHQPDDDWAKFPSHPNHTPGYYHRASNKDSYNGQSQSHQCPTNQSNDSVEVTISSSTPGAEYVSGIDASSDSRDASPEMNPQEAQPRVNSSDDYLAVAELADPPPTPPPMVLGVEAPDEEAIYDTAYQGARKGAKDERKQENRRRRWLVALVILVIIGAAVGVAVPLVMKKDSDAGGDTFVSEVEVFNLTYVAQSTTQIIVIANGLNGTIPSNLFLLTELTHLDLSDNNLSGTIPTEFGRFLQLEYLDLSNNTLSGTLPIELARSKKLTDLYLQDNADIRGPIPKEISSLGNLGNMWLYNTDLTGAVPSSLCTSMQLHPRIDCEEIECECCADLNSLPCEDGASCNPPCVEPEVCHEGQCSCDAPNFLMNGVCKESLECTVVGSATVVCNQENVCTRKTYDSETVDCCQDGSCSNAIFYRSAVSCGNNSCAGAMFAGCSCCDGPGCPDDDDVPPCVDGTSNVDNFCGIKYLGSSCKAWGNPMCNEVQLSFSETPLHPAPSCNKFFDTNLCQYGKCPGVDMTGCTVLCHHSCASSFYNSGGLKDRTSFKDSVVDCEGGRACHSSRIEDSTVRCLGSNTCTKVRFDRSTVLCEEGGSCSGSAFYRSAVSCGLGSCVGAFFAGCSCCDGPGCPDETLVPRCTDGSASSGAFCGSKSLGSSCKAWENPLCESVQLALPEAPLRPAAKCTTSLDTNLCRAGECSGIDLMGCTVLCYHSCSTSFYNSGGVKDRTILTDSIIDCEGGTACHSSQIEDSTVRCLGSNTCTKVRFDRSTVLCEEGGSCSGSAFYRSAVSCGLGSCVGTFFAGCSCCDGPGCPDESVVPRCTDGSSSVEAFCGSKSLGSSCKAWGNPLCESTQLALQESPLRPAAGCTKSLDTNLCRAGECSGIDLMGCTVLCYHSCSTSFYNSGAVKDRTILTDSVIDCEGGTACHSSQIEDSTVRCLGSNTCTKVRFDRSTVLCEEGGSCSGSAFYRSAVTCELGSCVGAFFAGCSCCDGPGCPEETVVRRCTDGSSSVDTFCGSSFLGSSCKAWGNPLCEDIQLALPESPLRPAAGCTTSLDTNLCHAGKCYGIDLTGCTVLCYYSCATSFYNSGGVKDLVTFADSIVDCEGGSACHSSRIEDSTIRCLGRQTCTKVRFDRSEVLCDEGGSCSSAAFASSAVECGLGSCTGATFTGCSCCSGVGCPSADVVPPCPATTQEITNFCSGASQNSTCVELGNPFC